MATYDIDWLIENRVIMHRYASTMDLDGLSEQLAVVNDMINAADVNSPLVHVLMNTENLKEYPKQIAKVGRTAKALLDNPRLGWVISYGRDDRMIKFVTSAIGTMFKTRFRVFSTEQEAFEFLNSVDEMLPDLKSEE